MTPCRDVAPARHARACRALGCPPPSASEPRPRHSEATCLPQVARTPTHHEPPSPHATRSPPGRTGRCPPVHPRCFSLCAVPRRAPRALSHEETGLHLFKVALLSRECTSVVPSPRSAASASATPWPSGPLAHVQRRTATKKPPLGPTEARTAAICPAPSPPSSDIKPPRPPPPPGSAAQAHLRRLRPG
jgi:hypothetical protein